MSILDKYQCALGQDEQLFFTLDTYLNFRSMVLNFFYHDVKVHDI